MTQEIDAATRAAIEKAAQRRIQAIVEEAGNPNHFGAWTLFKREFLRFWRMSRQTILSPVITTLLYFLVFGYSLGGRLRDIDGVPYIDFLVPGLVMLGVISNAFMNSSFSLFISKIHGVLVDLLVSPLSYFQIMFGYVASSILRAMIIGGAIWGVAALMGARAWFNIPLSLLMLVLTALVFALLGLIVAILAEDFDHINLVPSFLITPLTFLGGVFYSIKMLPSPWDTVSRFNPILYMVNGLRYAMTGHSDVPYWQGLVCLVALSFILGAIVLWLLRTGYKLRD